MLLLQFAHHLVEIVVQLAHLPVEDVLQVGNVLEDGHVTANTTIRRQNDKHILVRVGKVFV